MPEQGEMAACPRAFALRARRRSNMRMSVEEDFPTLPVISSSRPAAEPLIVPGRFRILPITACPRKRRIDCDMHLAAVQPFKIIKREPRCRAGYETAEIVISVDRALIQAC